MLKKKSVAPLLKQGVDSRLKSHRKSFNGHITLIIWTLWNKTIETKSSQEDAVYQLRVQQQFWLLCPSAFIPKSVTTDFQIFQDIFYLVYF